MVAKGRIYFLVLSCFLPVSLAYIQVGIIVRKGDETPATIVDNAFKDARVSDSGRNSDIILLKEVVEKEDAISYHRAFCRLLSQGIAALLSPAASPYYSILSAYSHEYRIPFITTDLTEASWNSPTEVSLQPSTTRAILGLIQTYGWSGVIYIYDRDIGPENLHFIFLLGHRVLNLTLDGILKVSTPEEAIMYLRKLDKTFDNKFFHVILDTDPSTARDIVWRHVNDIHVRKKNFHFVLSQPTLETFWMTERTAFGALNITTFTITDQLEDSETSSKQKRMLQDTLNSNISSYYYYDAARVLMQAIEKLYKGDSRAVGTNITSEKRDCLASAASYIPRGDSLSKIIKQVNIKDGLTGRIQFQGSLRVDFDLNITQINSRGFHRIGSWSNGVLHLDNLATRDIIKTLPLVQNNGRLKVVSKISPPFMMLKATENGSTFYGNDRFEGYCKDMIDLLAQELSFEYDLHMVEDGQYGVYDSYRGKWTGIIGEIIQGKADLAVSDLIISGQRQRVVDYTDPYETVGFSVVLKNPKSISKLSSIFFFLSAFTPDVWICILFLAFVFCALFHIITKFTGAPDSIESASGIWGRKHAIVVNLWFAVGSSMMQGTGVYPRSISSRILTGIFWFFTLVVSSLFIASITAQIQNGTQPGDKNPQLAQLSELSLESIISESVSRGWPKIGLVYPSNAAIFVTNSAIPLFKKFAEYLDSNPDVRVKSSDEGLKRVQSSGGNYILLVEALKGQYAARQKPCDLVATYDSIDYAGYGLATPHGSQLTSAVSGALSNLQTKGILAHLHQKWWTDSNHCEDFLEESSDRGTIHVLSGLLCVAAVGFLIISAVFGIQYIRRNRSKESRRQQLSFEDMNLGQSFPAPPPELLAEPAPVLNLPEYDKRTLL